MDRVKGELTPRFQEKRPKLDPLNSAKKEPGTPVRFKIKTSINSSEDVRKVTVAVRIRPYNIQELTVETKCPLTIKDNEIVVNSGYSSDATSLTSTFYYDNVFWSSKDGKYEYSDQEKVFNDIASPLLQEALKGYNVCLFAYGQTGSGKSYSMMGHDNSLNGDRAGIIPRFCQELLKQNNQTDCFDKIRLSMSYFEIYNEKIHDLLSGPSSNDNKISLRVREHPIEGPYVEGLSKHSVNSIEEVFRLLNTGNRRRATSATVHNNHSSRSHGILELSICCSVDERSVSSKVSLVDLAGSERVSQHNITGEHFREGLSINKSLLTLGKVITSLSDIKGSFIPYRESVLTWLLKESLGGNSKTVMLATVSPSLLAVEETLSTLRYACQARHILNKVVVNEDPQLKLIRELKAEVDRLKSLHDYKKSEQTRIKGQNSEEVSLGTGQYIKYENDLRNIERAQKLVEEQLQAELSRIGLHLQAAERRRDELESQKNVFIEKIIKNDVSQYKSDFYQNLQEILNNSTPSASLHTMYETNSKEVIDNLDRLKKSLRSLKNICIADQENSLKLKRIQPLVEDMDKRYHDICEILQVNSL